MKVARWVLGAVLVVGLGAVAVRSVIGGPWKIPKGSALVLRPVAQTWGPVVQPGWTPYRMIEQRGETIPLDWRPNTYRVVNLRRASRVVHLSWEYGSCEDKDFTVYLRETPEQVVLDLWNDQSFSGACDAVGNLGYADVELDAPLGKRSLLKHRIEPPPTD